MRGMGRAAAPYAAGATDTTGATGAAGAIGKGRMGGAGGARGASRACFETASDSSSGIDVPPIMANRFQTTRQLGRGSFGDVFLGLDLKHNVDVAIKIEVGSSEFPQLVIEEGAYRRLVECSNPGSSDDMVEQADGGSGDRGDGGDRGDRVGTGGSGGTRATRKGMPLGFPRIFAAGLQKPLEPRQTSCRYIVMDVLGASLEDLRVRQPKREDGTRGFDNLTLLMLADQMLQRLETVHDCGMLHRDLKPENFLMGYAGGFTEDVVHLVDFGLCKMWRKDGKHIGEGDAAGTVGTQRYMSINQHKQNVSSRRDDIECLCYVLAFLGVGRLPWQGLKGKTARAETLRLKQTLSGAEIAPGCPAVLPVMLDYVRSKEMGFTDRPPYAEFRKACHGAAEEEFGADAFDPRRFAWKRRDDDWR